MEAIRKSNSSISNPSTVISFDLAIISVPYFFVYNGRHFYLLFMAKLAGGGVVLYTHIVVMFIDSSDKYDIQIKHNNTI